MSKNNFWNQFEKVEAPKPNFSWDKYKKVDSLNNADKSPGIIEQMAKSTVDELPVIGGVIGGAIGTPLDAVTGPAGTMIGAGIGGYLGSAAKNMINNYVDPEKAPQNLTDTISEPIKEGLKQASLQGVGEIAAPVVSRAVGGVSKKAADYFEKVAEMRAARALGLERGTFKKLGEDKVRSIGKYALDEGVVTPLSSTEKMADRNEALMNKGGKMMEEAYKAVDDQGASTFNPLEVATKIDEKIGNFWRSPLNKSETSQLENTLESVLMRGEKNIPLTEAQTLKEELRKAANFNKSKALDVTPKEQMARDAYFIVSDSIDEAAKNAESIINKAGLSEKLLKGKELYSKASGASTLLENRAARESGNKTFGLSDNIWIGAGGATALQNPELASKMAGLFVAKKAGEKYGNQVISTGANKVANIIRKSPDAARALSAPVIQLKGEDLWAKRGIQNLGLLNTSYADEASKSKSGKALLIEASDLSPNSKKLKEIKQKIMEGNY